MELNQTQRKKGLLEKIPDIEKTLKVVDFLLERKTKVSSTSFLHLLSLFSAFSSSLLELHRECEPTNFS